MRAGGHGELELTVDIIEVGQTDVTHVWAAVAGIAEAEGALWIVGIDLREEPAGVPVWGEEFDDGLGIEVESGASGFACGAAVGEEFGVLNFGDEFRRVAQRNFTTRPS